MQATDDLVLLREYARNRSESAFETLVSRYVGLVHTAALRQTRNPQLAEEVTQAVFILLAKKAGELTGETILSGWLYKTTRFVAMAQWRSASKRRHLEQELHMQAEVQSNTPDPLWEQISPLLDDALMALGETDRSLYEGHVEAHGEYRCDPDDSGSCNPFHTTCPCRLHT